MKKSKTRIFINQSISANLIIYIKNKQHHFLKNVLRSKINDQINIFDGKSGEWQAVISSINRDNTVLRVMKNIKILEKSPDIWLILAPIKQNKMSIAIQKATELGVSKIIPCLTTYTNIKKINLRNLKENTIDAAEQSERLDIPSIEKEINLSSLLNNWPKDRKLIYCDETIRNDKFIIESLLPYKNTKNKFAVLVGPEGGFAENEKILINEFENIISVSLGKRVLRSDTAITVALFCIQQILS
tara:strand:- start:273 stop:1004 length:732 start_codon:yes stop_codon:yes gene_type:complete